MIDGRNAAAREEHERSEQMYKRTRLYEGYELDAEGFIQLENSEDDLDDDLESDDEDTEPADEELDDNLLEEAIEEDNTDADIDDIDDASDDQ